MIFHLNYRTIMKIPKKISDESLASLIILAEKIYQKYASGAGLIVPFIGAGCSAIAGIPVGSELIKEIKNKFCGTPDCTDNTIEKILSSETKKLFGHKGRSTINDLSFFGVASVLSQFAYGRTIIDDVVTEAISNPTKKPLCYELLAHLAKHGFIDHFVSVNFDELLDESLRDEIPNRLREIIGPEDLPGPNFEAHKNSPCYLLKPFGSLEKKSFKLNPEEVLQFGSDSLWQFCLDKIFKQEDVETVSEEGKHCGLCNREITLILVGYAAKEEAFTELVQKLAGNNTVNIFNINTLELANPTLNRLNAISTVDVQYIESDADQGIDLLVQAINHSIKRESPDSPIIPTSRHKIISNCMSYHQASINISTRFKTEVILQAIKSRGFNTIESICDIKRIERFSAMANKDISDLCSEHEILCTNSCTQDHDPKNEDLPFCLPTDLELLSNDIGKIAEELITIWKKSKCENFQATNADTMVDIVLKEDNKKVEYSTLSMKEYLEKRLEKILIGPDIEIKGNIDSSAKWIFKNPIHLRSIPELCSKTAEIFRRFLNEKGDKKKIYAVWSSGEWLLHEDGFAFNRYGKEVFEMIKNGEIEFHAIFIEPHNYGHPTFGSDRGTTIHDKLIDLNEKSINKTRKCKVNFSQLKWWKHNRKLTLLRIEDNESVTWQEGIYFRRKMATPLVAPIHLINDDCDILYQIYRKYYQKTQ